MKRNFKACDIPTVDSITIELLALIIDISSFDEAHQLLLKLPLPPRCLKIVQTSEIVYHITRLAKVDLLQQITHLDFHILNHPTDVLHVGRSILHRVILLHLPCDLMLWLPPAANTL